MNDHKHTNRLAEEKSPYLQQHAYNPVDWYPWSEAAFEKAIDEGKPIFLSIGYSTCHWCHVMERESFEDQEVADMLNDSFVSIKVDREERPDVDHIYMEICQVLTGSGGWPLTIIMTPDKKPFFAGTYFPKRGRMGRQGLMDILGAVKRAWATNREELLGTSHKILEAMENRRERTSGKISEDVLEKAFRQFSSSFDDKLGGFRSAPKFPTPHNLYFLLRHWYMTKESKALEMVEKTLDSMYKGGIYDHIGFGFSRYSTDSKWLVPHFEKMLYDNALLAIAYLECYQATKDSKYKKTAEEIFTYILRDMTSPEGGFYSAEDADSEGVEGKFYVWSPNEVESVLGADAAVRFCKHFDITDKGNFEGMSIPNLIKSADDGEDPYFLEGCRQKLFEHREKRIHPHKDDKVLTAWNGLMIAALAIGGRVLGENKYTRAAERAVDFIFTTLVREDGRLLARYRDGEAAFLAYADDYAYMTWAMIELYETTFRAEHLQKAFRLNGEFTRLFWDEKEKGYFLYGSDGEELLTRPKDIYDGATPSANSVAALNLIRLSRLSSDSSYEEMSDEILTHFGRDINSYPSAYAYALTAIQYSRAKSKEIVIVDAAQENKSKVGREITKEYKDNGVGNGNGNNSDMLHVVRDLYLPFAAVLRVEGDRTVLGSLIANIESYAAIDEKQTAYVCEGYACTQPVTTNQELRSLLM